MQDRIAGAVAIGVGHRHVIGVHLRATRIGQAAQIKLIIAIEGPIAIVRWGLKPGDGVIAIAIGQNDGVIGPVTRTNVEGIVARATVDRVGTRAGAECDGVVAIRADHAVVARAQHDVFDICKGRGRGAIADRAALRVCRAAKCRQIDGDIAGNRRGVQGIAIGLGGAPTFDGVIAEIVFQHKEVIAPATEHGVVVKPTFKRVVAIARGQRVVAGATDDKVSATIAARGQRIVAILPQKRVVARCAIKIVVSGSAKHRVVAKPAFQAVVPGIAEHGVVARATIDRVILGSAVKKVVARVTINLVFARATGHGVRIVATTQRVIAQIAVNRVIATFAKDGVGVIAAFQRIFAQTAQHAVGAGAAGEAIVATLAQQDIVAGVAKDRVIAIAATDTVIARACINGVVAKRRDDRVIAITGKDAVIVVAGGVVIAVDKIALGVVKIPIADEIIPGGAFDDVIAAIRNADGDQFLNRVDRSRRNPDQGDAFPAGEAQNSIAAAIVGDRDIRRGDRRCAAVRSQARDIQLVVGRAIAAVSQVKAADRICARAIGQNDRVTATAKADILDLAECGG